MKRPNIKEYRVIADDPSTTDRVEYFAAMERYCDYLESRIKNPMTEQYKGKEVCVGMVRQ